MYAFAVERLWFLGHRVESTPFRKLPNQVYKNQKRATLTTYGHAFRQPKCPAVRMFHPYWFFCYRLITFLPHACSRGCYEGRWNTFIGANVTLFVKIPSTIRTAGHLDGEKPCSRVNHNTQKPRMIKANLWL